MNTHSTTTYRNSVSAADTSPARAGHRPSKAPAPRSRRLRRAIAAVIGIVALGTAVGVAAQPGDPAEAAWLACDGAAQPLLGRNNAGGAFVRVRFSCAAGTPVGWYLVEYKKSQSDAAWQNAGWVMTNRRFTNADGSLTAQRIESYSCPRGYDLRVWGWGGYFSGSTPVAISGAYASTGVLRC